MAENNNNNTAPKKVKVILQKGKSYQVGNKILTGEILVEKEEAKRLVDTLMVASYPKKKTDKAD